VWGPNISVSTPIGHTRMKSGARSGSAERSSAAVYSEMAPTSGDTHSSGGGSSPCRHDEGEHQARHPSEVVQQ
jgi:hypothetical protein